MVKSDSSPLQQQGVSFRIRRLEYLIAWALALGTGWSAIVLFPGEWGPWLAALFAAAIGAWSRAYPAHQASLMMARAVLLLCAAFSLQANQALGGVSGAFSFWPLAIACTYAMLLEWRLSVTLTVLCAVQYVLLLWLESPASLRPALSGLGVLLVWPSVTMMLARSMHLADATVESGLTDAQTRLYNTDGLLQHGADLFRQCRRENRPLCIALLQFDDLAGAHQAIGRGATTQVLAHAVRDILSTVPGAAIAARTQPQEYTLVMPDMTSQRAKALLETKLGQPPCIKGELEGRKVVIPVEMAVTGVREKMLGIEDLLDRVRYKMKKRQLPSGDSSNSTTDGSTREPGISTARS